MSSRNSYQLSEMSNTPSDPSLKHNVSVISREDTSYHHSTQHPDNYQGRPQNPAHTSDPATSDLLPDKKSRRRVYDRAFVDGWGWELFAWLLAATSLIALIIVFAAFRDKALAQWKSNITPNTVVSILSQIGQTAILAPVTVCICQSGWLYLAGKGRIVPSLFKHRNPQLADMQAYDDGSRGPISSLFLLWKHPELLLVWLGSVNTILIILFGSFAQQTLQLPIREHNLTEQGSIQRTLTYRATPVEQTLNVGQANGFSFPSVTQQMNTAITNGLLGNSASPSDISGTCPTGNCTFAPYKSLGVCSNIVDVSSSITSKCRNTGAQFASAGCNYSVPEINDHPTGDNSVFEANVGDRILWVGASNVVGNGYKYSESDTLIRFYVIYTPDPNFWDSNDYVDDHKDQMVALQAELNLCILTYNTTMTFGVTKTTELSRSTDLDWNVGQEITDDTQYSTTTASQNSETFWMDDQNVQAFRAYLSLQTFRGTAMNQPESQGLKLVPTRSYDTDTAKAIQAAVYGDPAGMLGLSKLLDNLAVGMTNAYALPSSSTDSSADSILGYVQPLTTSWLIPASPVLSRCTSRLYGRG